MLFDSMNTIRNNFHFSERQEYIDLAKDFLADQITADDFSSDFISIYKGIDQEIAQMEKDESLELTNFLKTSQFELNDLLSQIYSTCDFFGHVIFDEKELKEKIKKFRQDELDHKDIAYENGATKKGLFGVLDKVIKTSSRIAITISEKI